MSSLSILAVMNGTVSSIFLIQITSKQLKRHLGQFALRYASVHHADDLIWTETPNVLLTWTTIFVNYYNVANRRIGWLSDTGGMSAMTQRRD